MEYSVYTPHGRLELNISEFMVPMTDGAALYTLLFTPADAAETLPIVLIRSPYVMECPDFAETARNYAALLHGGYAVIFQHCRGCGRSGGECDPYQHEREDGLDTLAWIRTLPFYQHISRPYPISQGYSTMLQVHR